MDGRPSDRRKGVVALRGTKLEAKVEARKQRKSSGRARAVRPYLRGARSRAD